VASVRRVGPTRRRLDARDSRKGFIHCYGLFWSVDEVWPEGERGAPFRLLGKLGQRAPGLQVCDFRDQRGIYVLYDEYGPHYVGLTREQPLGNRLADHRRDKHAKKWDRFSWFGFKPVRVRCLLDGTHALGELPLRRNMEARSTIGDVEALLIQALGTRHRGNAVNMRFASADNWTQVKAADAVALIARLPKPTPSRAVPSPRIRRTRASR